MEHFNKEIAGRFIRICRLMFVLIFVLSLVQVSHAKPKAAQKPSQSDKAPAVEDQVGSKEDKAPTEKKYVYNPAGKNDPFESFLVSDGVVRGTNLSAREEIPDIEETIIPEGEPRTELERIELSKLTLTSIIRGEKKVVAMVVDPKGRGYFLEEGTKIGTQSGFVDEIIAKNEDTDFGLEILRKVIIKVPYRDRNKNIVHRSIEMELPQTSL